MDKTVLFQRLGQPQQKNKADVLFAQGTVDRAVYFVQSGLLKAFYTTPDGKELIKSFIRPGEFIGSLTSCRSGDPSPFSLSCLEPSRLFKVEFASLLEMTAEDPQVANFVTKGLMDLAEKKERREYEFLCLSAPERYALFKRRYPDLTSRVTQNDIARYLGITPVALSRIKQRD